MIAEAADAIMLLRFEPRRAWLRLVLGILTALGAAAAIAISTQTTLPNRSVVIFAFMVGVVVFVHGLRHVLTRRELLLTRVGLHATDVTVRSIETGNVIRRIPAVTIPWSAVDAIGTHGVGIGGVPLPWTFRVGVHRGPELCELPESYGLDLRTLVAALSKHRQDAGRDSPGPGSGSHGAAGR